jgi:nitrogen regulatory protein PII
MMNMIMIVYNEVVEEELVEILEGLGIHSYTKWQRVLGRGDRSSPHMDTHIWPGTNAVLGIVLEDADKTRQLTGRIRKLDEQVGDKGLFALMWPVDRIV